MGLERKRLCYILTDSFLGGTERFLLKILKKINMKKFEIMVITLIGNGDLNRRCEELGIRSHNLKFTKLNSLVNFFKLKKLVSEFNPDIIHSFLFHANYFSAHLKKSLNTPLFIASERCLDLKKSRLKIKLTKFYSKYADVVTAVSVEVMDLLIHREGIPGEKLVLFQNGIDPETYNLEQTSTLRKEFNIPESAKVIVNIGRLRIEKGHCFLINAFHKLRRDFPGSYLILSGNGDRENELKKLVKDGGIEGVIFTGERHDVINILKGADLAVNSSLEEGFSAFNLEAILAGTPIIMTNIGGNKELLAFGIGSPMEPGNTEDYYLVMKKAMENIDSFREKVPGWKKKMLEEYSFKKITEQLEVLYDI